MGTLWKSYGNTMGAPRKHHENTTETSWVYHGRPMGMKDPQEKPEVIQAVSMDTKLRHKTRQEEVSRSHCPGDRRQRCRSHRHGFSCPADAAPSLR